MQDTAHISARVTRYIVDNFMYAFPNATLAEDDALLARGIIDSLGVVELIGFIEEEFGVTLPDGDITEANLGSVGAITRYLASRLPAGATASAA